MLQEKSILSDMGSSTIEIWKPVKGFEKYEVSNLGNVRSHNNYCRKQSVYMKARDNGYGYLVVQLRKDCKRQNRYLHRIVAEAFIDNPHNLPEVNHIDFNRHNNNVQNLEWVTRKDNVAHSLGRGKHPRPITKATTGEKYIYQRKGYYRVAVYGCSEKSCKTLEKAVLLRDQLVKEKNYKNWRLEEK